MTKVTQIYASFSPAVPADAVGTMWMKWEGGFGHVIVVAGVTFNGTSKLTMGWDADSPWASGERIGLVSLNMPSITAAGDYTFNMPEGFLSFKCDVSGGAISALTVLVVR